MDDDSTFLFLTKKLILATRIVTRINEFYDGQQALDYLKANLENQLEYPDVIFLDLSMPVLDGWDFLEEFLVLQNSLKKKIRLYIVSSSISPHDIERAKNYRFVDDFIIKPLLKEKFLEIIDAVYRDETPGQLAN